MKHKVISALLFGSMILGARFSLADTLSRSVLVAPPVYAGFHQPSDDGGDLKLVSLDHLFAPGWEAQQAEQDAQVAQSKLACRTRCILVQIGPQTESKLRSFGGSSDKGNRRLVADLGLLAGDSIDQVYDACMEKGYDLQQLIKQKYNIPKNMIRIAPVEDVVVDTTNELHAITKIQPGIACKQ